MPAIGAVSANRKRAARLTRSPPTKPSTSLPNRLWPLLVTATSMSGSNSPAALPATMELAIVISPLEMPPPLKLA